MSEKFERYNLEKAQDEAAKMQDKIKVGEAKDYNEAENIVDKENFSNRIKDLKNKLQIDGDNLDSTLREFRDKKTDDGRLIVEVLLERDYVNEFKDMPIDIFTDIMIEKFQELYGRGSYLGGSASMPEEDINWLIQLARAIDKDNPEKAERKCLIETLISRTDMKDFNATKIIIGRIGKLSDEESKFLSEKLSNHFSRVWKSTTPFTAEFYKNSGISDEVIFNSVRIAIEKIKNDNYLPEEYKIRAVSKLKEWFNI